MFPIASPFVPVLAARSGCAWRRSQKAALWDRSELASAVLLSAEPVGFGGVAEYEVLAVVEGCPHAGLLGVCDAESCEV